MRVTPMKTNFTAGELSPRVYGRTDIDRYQNAAKRLENMFVLVQGGAIRRYGLRYTQPVKEENRHTILIPYVFNREQAYMLEFGDAYVRVYLQNGAQVLSSDGVTPYEIATGYFESDLDDIDYVQSGDTMLLFHEQYPTRRLRRFGDAAWVIEDVPWVNVPAAEVGERPGFNAFLDSLALGPGRVITAGGVSFRESDIGREVEYGGGLALITGYTDEAIVTVDVLTPFPSLSLPLGQWVITGSPYTTLTPSWSGGTGNEQPAVGEVIDLTLALGGWRSTDVGKLVELNAGLVQITSVTSYTAAQGELRKAMSALVAVPALAWVLMGPAWSDQTGYPRTGTFFEQRLWCAGSRQFPRTIWGSRIGEYLDFELGTDADSAISIQAASEQQDAITHLTNLGALVALSGGGIITVRGTDDSAIAPNAKNKVMAQPNFGCNTVSPERIGTELMYVQRGGRKVRALSADRVDTDTYVAPDITVLAEHMVQSTITRLAFQDEPDPLLFALCGNGTLATATIDRDQNVIGWTPQGTEGFFDAVAALPTADGMQVWVVVRRLINGVMRRYVERFDPTLYTDCAITGTSPGGATIWSGLDHLEGLAVKVRADGVVLNDRVVTGGEITIERPAFAIEIGVNFTPRIELLRPAVDGEAGTSQNSNIRVSEVVLRFLNSTGAVVNGQEMFSRVTGLAVLDQPPPLITGDERIEQLGWDMGDFELVITQPQPYPFHLQAVITTMTVNK